MERREVGVVSDGGVGAEKRKKNIVDSGRMSTAIGRQQKGLREYCSVT